jgi:hypothetical protein
VLNLPFRKWFDHWMSISQDTMSEELLQFTVPGSPRDVARAVEEFAVGLGSLTAIVVPWESDRTTLVMTVTSTQGEGRFLEHTDLGTVRLIDLGNASTRVAVEAKPLDHAEKQRMAALFVRFTSQIQTRFQVAP